MAACRRLLIFYAVSKRFQATPRQEWDLEGGIGSKPLESFERKNVQQSPDIASGFNRGNRIRTNAEKALKTRAFNDSEFLGEQFGEQFGIKEQILTLFEKLGADEQAALLEALTARVKTAADISR